MPISRLRRVFQESGLGWVGTRQDPIIGLDLGSEAITFVECRRQQGRWRLARWGFHKIDSQILQQGRIKNRPALVQTLHAFVEQFRLRAASVAMAVNGASVIVKRIQVPRHHQHDLDQYLLWEAPQYIPYDPEDVYVDCALRPSLFPISSSEDLELLLVASKREAVDERREVLEEVNLRPVICDVEALAIHNITGRHREVRTQNAYLLVHIQRGLINVIVVAKGEPLLVRDVDFSPISGQSFTNKPSDRRSPSHWSDDVQSSSEDDTFLFEELIRFEMVSELNRTVEGAQELLHELNLEKIFLCSNFQISDVLIEEIKQSLSIPVSLIDPFESFEWNQDGVSPSPLAGVAGGLALRARKR